MSGSSLDGLDIAFVQLQENGGKWSYEILQADCIYYDKEWTKNLKNATNLTALDYQLLHTAYGHYLGKKTNEFIEKNNLHHQVNLIASHGHTTFHLPEKLMTAQLGDGAAIAAQTKLPVVSDLRNLDIAFGGQGAPIVPIGEKLLFSEYSYFLNIGGIANISARTDDNFIAFDVCAANRVLNMLAIEKGFSYDEDGKIAAAGNVNEALLQQLNNLEYYKEKHPKSLANSFGIETVYPIIKTSAISIEDAMRTYVEHIVFQLKIAIVSCQLSPDSYRDVNCQLLVTGGGAFNLFLVKRLQEVLEEIKIEIIVPDKNVINYKEALIMALIGTLRWREEYNVLASVTGASQNSIGGALWLGTEA